MAMRQVLTLLLAHHPLHSAVPNALGSLKDLPDEVYSGDAVEEEIRDDMDGIIKDANTLVKSVEDLALNMLRSLSGASVDKLRLAGSRECGERRRSSFPDIPIWRYVRQPSRRFPT
jgi:hypothetical protein